MKPLPLSTGFIGTKMVGRRVVRAFQKDAHKLTLVLDDNSQITVRSGSSGLKFDYVRGDV